MINIMISPCKTHVMANDPLVGYIVANGLRQAQ